MPRSAARHDPSCRFVGLLTFFGGVAMLALVFSLAYHLFTQPVPGLNLSDPPQAVPPPAVNIGIALSSFLVKLLLLALLTIVGSLVASKGIHLVFAAAHGAGIETAPAASKNGTSTLPAVTPSTTQAVNPPP